ncbi:hypothetical protein CJ030_MR5G023723 [Morella rubra]|uniref:Uncharacterized protein n=1 Tax=Morella rubra TaxID=262757 RepID=A0A6A1VGI3_9ROSI|nr:hypothetical protein CJ030_MR5G023723 [Morella rubra]
MIKIRWMFSFSIVVLLFLSQSLQSSAHGDRSVLNPVSRVVVGQHQLQERPQILGDGSFYNNRKLAVHIKRRGGFGTRAGLRRSSAVGNLLSSFHVGSLLCISLLLGVLVI